MPRRNKNPNHVIEYAKIELKIEEAEPLGDNNDEVSVSELLNDLEKT